MTRPTDIDLTRAALRCALGPNYPRRLRATYDTLIDAEGHIRDHLVRRSEALSEVLESMRRILEEAALDY